MANPKTRIDLKNNEIVFWLDSKFYPMEAIYSAAYVFLDRAYVYLDGDPEKDIEIHLKGKEDLNREKLEALRGEFLNELLNFLLRVEITGNNKKIREYIVASALVSSLPAEILNQPAFAEDEASDWKDDPLGIAVPWEEKKNKSAKKKKSARP